MGYPATEARLIKVTNTAHHGRAQVLIANPVIVFHGTQGSGKSAWSAHVVTMLNELGTYNPVRYGIKSTFSDIVTDIFKTVERDPVADLLMYKEVQRKLSTGAEKANPMIWSDMFRENVLDAYANNTVVMDDCRTKMNLDALTDIAKTGRTVLFFALHASEEIRKQRVSIWRPPVDYTEQMLKCPDKLPDTFWWYDIDTSGATHQAAEAILTTVLRHIQ